MMYSHAYKQFGAIIGGPWGHKAFNERERERERGKKDNACLRDS
jgi:hypothetical protein